MRWFALIAVIACVLFCGILPARADKATDWVAVEALNKELIPLRQNDPRQAVARCNQYLKERPDADPWAIVLVGRWLSTLHCDKLNDPKAAMAACENAIARCDKQPAVMAPVAEKARLLLLEKKAPDAEALILQYWEWIPQTHKDYSNGALAQYVAALEQQGKKAEVIAALRKAILEIPVLVDDAAQSPPGWIYDRLQRTLVAAGKMDEALQWAKLRYAACAFDTPTIERCTRGLVGCWTAKDLSQRTARAFAEAQQDPAKPNPLKDVKLPELPAEAGQGLAPRAFGRSGVDALHDRISACILTGDLRAAMNEARQAMIENPDSGAGVQEICRVLKANDAGVRRANAFIEYVRGGEGANPLDEFFKEHPDGDSRK